MTKEMADEGMKGMQQFVSDPTQARRRARATRADPQAHLQEVSGGGREAAIRGCIGSVHGQLRSGESIVSHSVSRQTVGGPAEPGGPACPHRRRAARRRRPRTPAPSIADRARQRRAAFLFLAPACVMVAIYVVWPILSTIRLSFFNWDGMTRADVRRSRELRRAVSCARRSTRR